MTVVGEGMDRLFSQGNHWLGGGGEWKGAGRCHPQCRRNRIIRASILMLCPYETKSMYFLMNE